MILCIEYCFIAVSSVPFKAFHNDLGNISECVVLFKWVMEIWSQLDANFHSEFIRRTLPNKTDMFRSKEGFVKRKFCKLQHGFWLITQNIYAYLYLYCVYYIITKNMYIIYKNKTFIESKNNCGFRDC